MEDPRLIAPTFAGIDTFWRSAYLRAEEVSSGYVAVLGAPHDMTLSTRQGTRHGPKAIRQHSCHFITQTRSTPTSEYVNVLTGRKFRVPDLVKIVDVGDIVLYPNDLGRTESSVIAAMQAIVTRSAFPLVLGGDHYLTYPLFKGFADGLTQTGKASKIGFLQIDAHFDLMKDNKLWGKHWHGSSARLIADLPQSDVANMVWLGTNGFAWADEWDFVQRHALTFYTVADIQRLGIRDATTRAIDKAAENVDAVYVSLDIDVVDIAYAPGTGSTNFGGISGPELLEALDVLSNYDLIKALDLMEVAPPLDSSGRTARLAANALLAFLAPRLFERL